MSVDCFELIGRLVWVGLDAEGNINIIVWKNDRSWAETAVRVLKRSEGRIVKMRFRRFRRNLNGTPNPLKAPRNPIVRVKNIAEAKTPRTSSKNFSKHT